MRKYYVPELHLGVVVDVVNLRVEGGRVLERLPVVRVQQQ
jgi:hypothetical protein